MKPASSASYGTPQPKAQAKAGSTPNVARQSQRASDPPPSRGQARSKKRLPAGGYPVPQGSRVLYHCGTPGCVTRTSLHLLAFSCKTLRPLCGCPTCVKYELKTFYCPQTLLPSTDAAQDEKRNRSATAFNCPECFSSLVLHKGTATSNTAPSGVSTSAQSDSANQTIDGNGSSSSSSSDDFHFACPYCRWNSLPRLHDVSPKMLYDSAFQMDRDAVLENRMNDAVDRSSEVHEQWSRSAASRTGVAVYSGRAGAEKGTRAILARLRSLTTVRSAGMPSRRGNTAGSGTGFFGNRKGREVTWQDFEDERLAQTMARPQQQLALPLLGEDAAPKEVSLAADMAAPVDIFTSRMQTNEHCMNNEGGDSDVPGQPIANLLPLRQPLRVKRSVRCKETQAILIHPNVNPQQGDSNFGRNMSARWFEMDEFASEYIPRTFLHRVTAQDVVGGSDSVLVELVVEIRKPRAMVVETDELLLTMSVRPSNLATTQGLVFDIPLAPLVLTKSSGTTKDQTAATTDPKNAQYVISSSDGAVLLRLKAIAPTSGPVTFPLQMHVEYPVKYKYKDKFSFDYKVDIETISP